MLIPARRLSRLNIDIDKDWGEHVISNLGNILQATGSYLQLGQTAPTSPTAGDLYYDATENRLKLYDGSVWREFPESYDYLETSMVFFATNLSGGSAYFYTTNATSPTTVDWTFLDWGAFINRLQNIYGSSVQVAKKWIELTLSIDTDGQTAYAQLYNFTDGVALSDTQVSSTSTSKSNVVQMPIPDTLDETKIYALQAWSSDSNANAVLGTTTFKALIKYIKDEVV